MKTNIFISMAMTIMPFMVQAAVCKQNLGDNWKFRQARTLAWHEASVPGNVHTDLMSNGIIPDPFIGQNERAVQWVDKEDWIYETTFNLDDDIVGKNNIDLVFDGLDTYADVYVNDSLVLKADNMFRKWSVPVKGLVKPVGNKQSVYFPFPNQGGSPQL